MEPNYTVYSFRSIFSFIVLLSNTCTYINAQPANDAICSAITLIPGANFFTSGTNVNSTTVAGDPIGSCWVGGTKSHTVWFKFVAPTSANVTITTYNTGSSGTLTDSQIGVYTSSNGTCTGTLTEVGCNDDISSRNLLSTTTLTGLVAGSTYFIELNGYSALTGSFSINIYDGGPILTNDNSSNAMTLYVSAVSTFQFECTYTNYPFPSTLATGESWEIAPACWTQGLALNSVWFKFTALATSTRLQIPTNDGSSTTDPHAGIYTGSPGSLTLVACQEDKASGGGGGSVNRSVDITFPTTVGTVYYIQYDSNIASGGNNIALSCTGGLTIPANDACSAATTLTLNTPMGGNNWLATPDGTFSCGTTENSVWYKYTPITTANYNFTLSNQTGMTALNNSASPYTNFYAANEQLAVYNTVTCTPTSANQLGCADPINTSDYVVNASLTAGSPVLVLVDGLGGAAGKFNLTVTQASPLPVELLMFVGKNMKKYNVLEWTTGSETDNDYFGIERSEDAINFTQIGILKGKGNTLKTSNYLFIDNEPLNEIGYYRLTQTDYNGKINYPGEVISINFPKQENTFEIYPNPNDGGHITIRLNHFNEKEILIIVNDSYGRELYSKVIVVKNKNETIEAIDPYDRLTPGIYLITGTSNNQLYKQKIIIK